MIKLLDITGTKYVEGRRVFNKDGTITPYVVTEDGQLWSDELEGYRSLDTPTDDGTIMVSVSLDGEWKKAIIYRLVAQYFLSNEYNFPCVNHKDSNRLNNHYTNLEWCTYEYNSRYAVVHGNSNYDRMTHRHKLDKDQIREICEMLQNGYRNIDIARTFGVEKWYIENIKQRTCHTAISKDYDFGDNYVYYGNNLTGNEGNHYIPPLPDDLEPKYIKRGSPEHARQICEALSQDDYVSSSRLASKFNISKKFVHDLRYGKIYPDIVSEYNINNNKSTQPRRFVDDDEELIENIFKLASTGEYTARSIGTELDVSSGVICRVLDDPAYSNYRYEYPINLKQNRKGYPLTDEEKEKIIKLVRIGRLTKQGIANEVGVSLASVTKIKRLMKQGILK